MTSPRPRAGRALRRLFLLPLVLGGALLAPAAAHAAMPWVPCTSPAGFQCARLTVPLDRTGAVPGTVSLAVTRVPSPANATRSAVVALAGGPGQAAIPLAQDFATILAPATGARDLVVFDQRGTGSSGALSCPEAERRSRTLPQLGADCGAEIGPGRGAYRTVDSVEDIEAIRVAGDYDKLVLFGVSYGTKVALEYAQLHPDHVEALVLDSVVAPEGPDPLRVSSLAATVRVTADVCANGACAAATSDAVRDLTTLAARLRKRAIRGSVVTSSGRMARATLTQSGLFSIYLAGDLNPTLRAELPGAVRAALTGDPTPILRLSVRSAGLTNASQGAGGDSNALFLATTCEESPFPWTRTDTPPQRASEVTAATRTLPAGALGPFSRSVALDGGVVPLCVAWPTASAGQPALPPIPAVPTLILDGQFDVRTPVEDAAAVAARIPGSQFVTVPYTGHSVLGSDLLSCASGAVASFFATGTAPPCSPGQNPFAPTARPPRSLNAVAASGVRGAAGRTLTAALATVTDARRQLIGETIALGRTPARVGGLRAGTVARAGAGFRLRGYSFVPRVTVSGRIAGNGSGRITVSGSAAARGSLSLSSSGAIKGRLGGRRINVAVATALGGGLPTLVQARALTPLR